MINQLHKKIYLSNGVRLVYEKLEHVRSVSVGIWIGTGSRNENKNNNGISHFVEHMLFKGTKKRSAKEIAESIDNIGGQLNAFTGKECTCYYAKTLDTYIDTVLEILSDILFNSEIEENNINIEKKVVVEEIGMYEDSPEELVHDVLAETVWSGNALGYPILGTRQCINSIDRDIISQYMLENYTPRNCVVSVAGNFDEQKLLKLVEAYFGSWQAYESNADRVDDVTFNANTRIVKKNTEQIHMCIAFNGIKHGNDDLYTLLAVSNLFGGGMSSRLFQKIREDKGLVYSVFGYPSSYRDAGLYTIYAGMNPKHKEEVASLIFKEIKALLDDGITDHELAKSKEQLKGNYILSLESTSSRMNAIGKSELMMDRIFTAEEILGKIDNINLDMVIDIINRVFVLNRIGVAAIGSIKKQIDFKKYIY